jgi:transcriptional regulator with XRE-family HTH domain
MGRKTIEQFKLEADAARLKEIRMLMGLSQGDVYKAIKMNPGQYSRIESGELSAEKPLKYLSEKFKTWRAKEIQKLQARIGYLKSI